MISFDLETIQPVEQMVKFKDFLKHTHIHRHTHTNGRRLKLHQWEELLLLGRCRRNFSCGEKFSALEKLTLLITQ